jgi:RimJ/RimL family protein N-acetyltransferase
MMMDNDFKIITPRLIIREVKMTDDEQILSAMSCPEIDSMHNNCFKNTGDVQRYISVLLQEYENKKFRTLAISEKISNQLIGAITIDTHKIFPRAELSYWISTPYRDKGYATEAVKAIISYIKLADN